MMTLLRMKVDGGSGKDLGYRNRLVLFDGTLAFGRDNLQIADMTSHGAKLTFKG